MSNIPESFGEVRIPINSGDDVYRYYKEEDVERLVEAFRQYVESRIDTLEKRYNVSSADFESDRTIEIEEDDAISWSFYLALRKEMIESNRV